MNYKDLQNISSLSQQILSESAEQEHSFMDRWPYTSPYLQEERAPGVKPYRPNPTQAEVRADEKKAEKKRKEASKGQSGYGPDEKFYKPEDKRIPDKDTAEWLRRTKSPYGKRITGKMGREYGSRQAAGVTRIVKGAGEPRAVKLPEAYDIVLEHLLEYGYANSVESAEAIMVSMSEEWRTSIIESYEV